MAKLANRAKMTISSTGTGNITLAAADTGYQTFAQAGISDGDVIRYIVEDASNAWEIGTAVVSNSSTVLARTVEESSNSGNALNLTSAAKVFVGITAKDLDGNVAPRFLTTPPTALDLNNDGSTAVTLNAKAYDEQGFPVNYTWDANIAGSTTIYNASSLPPQFASAPAINQSTGVFSIIGSSNSANGGAVNFRAKASDGVMTSTHVTACSLTFGFDLSVAAYDNKFRGVGIYESNPTSVKFNPAGTRMFMVGSNSEKVHQFTLSTAWNVDTSSYDSVTLDVSSQDSYPTDLKFNSSGTVMYMTGDSNNKTFVYNLSTAFDLSTASYSSNSYNFSSVISPTLATHISFNDDGTKLYISSNEVVTQCSLSTAYDLSTLSSDSKSFDAGNQVNEGSNLDFNTTGSKMFMSDVSAATVYEFSLSTNFDVSTASYNNVSFDMSSEGGSARGLVFGKDGEKMYMCTGSGGDRIYQYSVS